jgi:hypothetical protein
MRSSADTAEGRPRSQAVGRVVLLGALALAAVLRFAGIGWGLRQLPQQFERVFVQSVWDMVAAGDLDQRCYLYPGGVFYLLALPVWVVQRLLGLPIDRAYLASRCVAAGFGVASVFLTYRLGRALAGEAVALGGALLLAVSPLEIENAHALHPDVILEAVVLLAILVFRRVGPRVSGDLWSGLVLGVAGAVKVTGVLVAPVYVGYRLLAKPAAPRRIVLVAAASLLVLLVLTPQALRTPGRFLEGQREQALFHYKPRPDSPDHAQLLLFYVSSLGALLGPVGALLLVPGVISSLRAWRVWGPVLALPASAFLLLSTATLGQARFLLPAGGVLALVGSQGFFSMVPRRSLVQGLLAILALGMPLGQSLAFVQEALAPAPDDLALDWILANEPPGTRIVTAEKHLGLPRDRFDVIWPVTNFWDGEERQESDRALALLADLVVASPADPLVWGLRPLVRFDPGPHLSHAGPAVGLFQPPPRRRLGPSELHLRASENEGLLDHLLEGEGAGWHTKTNEEPSSWLQLDLDRPRTIGIVRLTFRNHTGSPLAVWSPAEDGTWRPVPFLERTSSAPPRAELLCGPAKLGSVRITPTKPYSSRWSVVGLEVEEVLGDDH